MTLVKRVTIVVIAIGCVLVLGWRFHETQSEQPAEPPRPHQVTLNWDKALRAASYNVYRRPYRIDTYTKLASSNTTSFEDPTVQSAERYCYVVTAVDSKARESAKSKEVCVTIPHP
jgi:fibronectin type 3 domain-containing protein